MDTDPSPYDTPFQGHAKEMVRTEQEQRAWSDRQWAKEISSSQRTTTEGSGPSALATLFALFVGIMAAGAVGTAGASGTVGIVVFVIALGITLTNPKAVFWILLLGAIVYFEISS
jgi:hypothetical protein